MTRHLPPHISTRFVSEVSVGVLHDPYALARHDQYAGITRFMQWLNTMHGIFDEKMEVDS